MGVDNAAGKPGSLNWKFAGGPKAELDAAIKAKAEGGEKKSEVAPVPEKVSEKKEEKKEEKKAAEKAPEKKEEKKAAKTEEKKAEKKDAKAAALTQKKTK